jgi:quinol-cytochrome oxidoreductase complex cytochrome b subunit/ferredoxin/coenzyme F420-reducing hydrogenase delta subunit
METMRQLAARLRSASWRLLSRADRFVNRLFGSHLNPLYHSGAIVVLLLVVLLITGLYLLIFYRIGEPHASVARITEQAWLGSWIRTLHRYGSDAAVVAVAVHAFRLFAQGRSWGPRTLAWLSGLALLFVLFVSGWTGYVMVWDVQAQLLAIEGARWMDVLPIFSEPLGRAFVGEQAIPSAFFFLNLFLHVALPVGMFVVLWVHVSRVARPGLLPPRGLLWGSLAVLLALSLAWPIGMDPPADAFRIPQRAALDVFYAFWLPLTRLMPAAGVWLLGLGLAAAALAAPLWTKPPAEKRPAPSKVDSRLCTGCEQCYLDCPYEAISMRQRTDGREGIYAVVDPALCVSCGICAGSCAPMGIGPPGMTGRDQLDRVEEFIRFLEPDPAGVVLVGCARGAAGLSSLIRTAGGDGKNGSGHGKTGGDQGGAASFEGSRVFQVPCAGNVHTSVVEYLVRSGIGGVLVVACHPRDCWSREGPRWLEQRMYHDREAELKPRVDRDRIRICHASDGESGELAAALSELRDEIGRLAAARVEAEIDLELECEVPELQEAGQ